MEFNFQLKRELFKCKKMDKELLDKVLDLIKIGKGDTARLEHIRDSIKKERKLYQSDQNYLKDLLSKNNLDEKKITVNDYEKKTVSELKQELGQASEKIEKMEEKIEEQQKTNFSIKKYKSEGTTLVLSIVVGLLGFLGVGHLYVGRVRRGVIILIIGLLSWTALFIPMVMLGMLAELEEDTFDPEAVMGMLVGFMMVGIGVLVLFIWQIFNSRKLCREYNEYLERHEKPPW